MDDTTEPVVDAIAFDLTALYREQALPMTRLAHAIVGSNAVAEELVHDAFVRLGRQPVGRVREPLPYLRAIVVNLSRNWIRRQVVARRAPVRPDALALGEPEHDDTWVALCRLPAKYRAVLALRYYDDLPDDEIADVLGVRRATVRSLVHRGLDLLRKELS
ncbi:MAG: sigma-70 family RNA polymerase sigma factor [Acidimicrobiales bacterium]